MEKSLCLNVLGLKGLIVILLNLTLRGDYDHEDRKCIHQSI